jgi:hypothetical protein
MTCLRDKSEESMGRCYNSAIINAPCDQVWQAISDFHDFSWAQGVITSVEKVGPLAGNQIGARRLLNDAFYETLVSIDGRERSFSYSIDDGPEPISKHSVKNYIGRVRVAPVTGNDTTFIEWESTYDANDDPAVGEFCNPIYQALLDALQKRFA